MISHAQAKRILKLAGQRYARYYYKFYHGTEADQAAAFEPLLQAGRMHSKARAAEYAAFLRERG